MTSMDVSVIVTVLNEQESVVRLLNSLASQTRRPGQVIICDGGSTDGTLEAIQSAIAVHGAALGEVEVIALNDANISEGRNAAIAHARGPLIAATDAGVRLHERWLEQITSPWESSAVPAGDTASAAAGFFVPEAKSVFETAMAATVLPAAEDVDPATFLPSSRSVAFMKDTWEAVGGYPEWLDYCEDLIFDFRVNDIAGNGGSGFAWCPDAIVYFRPRTRLRAFWKQYYLYARGDGKADLWRKRHAIRYATYGVALPSLLMLFFRGGSGRSIAGALLLWGGIAYCWRPWQRLRSLGRDLSPIQRAVAVTWVPVLRVVGDCAKMLGYPVGVLWRRRNWSRSEIHWRQRSE
jgi:glycosyltransferase involved in cell wall biosynthesis